MYNWKFIDKLYIYDGTIDGLFTIIFDSYTQKTIPKNICSKDIYISNFIDKIVNIETDYEKSKRIFNRKNGK